MDSIIFFLDYFFAIGIIISLNLVHKHNSMWVVYGLLHIACMICVIYKGLYGMAVMAFILVFTGIANYFINKNKSPDWFEEYSYYVGTELTCLRIPLKYGPWLTKKDNEDFMGL